MQSDQGPTFPSDHNAPAEWEVLNALIGEIYDSVLHPESWNETLARITGTLCPLSWEAAFILWESNSPPSGRFVAATGLAAGVQEIYTAVYAGHHPWSRKLMRYGNGSVVDSYDIMTREEFLETEFFRNFLAPWGIDRMIAVLLDKRGSERLGLMLPGPGDRDVERLKRGLRVLAPHMQRAMRISDRIATLDLAAGAARAATDAAPFAIFSLDDQLNILAANSRAARYEKAGFIRTAHDRFAFTHPPSQKQLLDLVRSEAPSGVAFQALGPSGKECPVLVARVTRQSAQQLGGVRLGASLIVTLGSAPGETPVVEIDRVAQWFGLTPAEARLAVALAAGDTLQDYAALRAVSVNAVRFLLKGIFRKTGATTQAQLVAQLARLPAPGSEN
ncbi:DNA-binding CsgD family transcriptional regulator/PAS domain-containing protein [Sphingopyxis sp. OAS728]|uniref:helix-turn-helix transcriptional regulator n=1 Tax=Sphingopyxis sp. OAS728 TaxID=2663823 RepID=UPI00178BE5C2|nr:helix-turn-helix transcriptional regulator [Sphingopyxis sp. OAS728]MBE1526544.1 DNA-binding CsgD family transcriptional regulator/PAS domain-containing protein [Sphingopyxis sp. OAS728]